MFLCQCTNCREHKPLTEFPARKRKSVDREWLCNACKRKHSLAVLQNEPEYLRRFNLGRGQSRAWINGIMASLGPQDY